MADYVIELTFEGLDVDDPDQIEMLADADVVTAEWIDAQRSRLTAVITHDDAVLAALQFIDAVRRVVPTAVPIAADRDLVSVTDIADRVGVTREAVRNWSAGKRRAGRFPAPVGTPSGSKVWEWTAVHSWLRDNLGIWDELEMPTHQEYATIEHLLRMRARADERPEFVRTRVLSEMAIESVRVRERVSSAISSSISWSREPTQVRQYELAS